MNKPHKGDKEEENIKVDLAKGYRFWGYFYNYISTKQSNSSLAGLVERANTLLRTKLCEVYPEVVK